MQKPKINGNKIKEHNNCRKQFWQTIAFKRETMKV